MVAYILLVSLFFLDWRPSSNCIATRIILFFLQCLEFLLEIWNLWSLDCTKRVPFPYLFTCLNSVLNPIWFSFFEVYIIIIHCHVMWGCFWFVLLCLCLVILKCWILDNVHDRHVLQSHLSHTITKVTFQQWNLTRGRESCIMTKCFPTRSWQQ